MLAIEGVINDRSVTPKVAPAVQEQCAQAALTGA